VLPPPDERFPANRAADPAFTAILRDMRLRLDHWMKKTADPLLAGPIAPPDGARVTPPGSINP